MNQGKGVGRSHAIAAALLSLTLATAGCGGGGGTGGSGGGTIPAPQPTATLSPKAVTVKATVDLPTSTTTDSKRRPAFVSPSTNGATLVAKDHTSGTTVLSNTYDFSSTSGLCTSGSPRTCTMSFAIVPGNYDWTLTLYDQAPSGGSIPGTAKTLGSSSMTQAINSNASNTLAFSVSAIVTGAPGVTCSPTACGALTYYSLPADGGSHTFTFAITFYDPDGNALTGSIPFTTSQTATLTETGGAGHSHLTLNGTNVGTTATITKATDTLALVYDGKGSAGYTTTTDIAGTSVVLSPMFVNGSGAPPAITVTNINQTVTAAIAEQGAPAGIAYAASNVPTCGVTLTPSATGSGASGTLTVGTTVGAGTTGSCYVNVKDTDSSTDTVTLTFDVPGPLSAGTPTFSGGGSGTCSSLAFTAAAQSATMSISDPLYVGGLFSASSSNTSVATVTESGTNTPQSTTIKAVAAGTATITYSDGHGNTLACSVGVTTSGGTVQ